MPIVISSGQPTSGRIVQYFRAFGKLIKLQGIAADCSADLKAQMLVIEEQVAKETGADDPYNELTTFTAPFIKSLQPTINTIGRVTMLVKTGCDNYLRTIATEFDLSGTATPTAVLNALKADMIEQEETVAPSGLIASYFQTSYGVSLPTDPSPTIDDAYVTTVVI